MTQKERWLVRYNDVVEFIETNHSNPSRHRSEEQIKQYNYGLTSKRYSWFG